MSGDSSNPSNQITHNEPLREVTSLTGGVFDGFIGYLYATGMSEEEFDAWCDRQSALMYNKKLTEIGLGNGTT